MPSFTRAPHAQPSLSNFPDGTQISASRPAHAGRPDSNEIFQLPPKIKKDQTYTSFAIHVIANNINPTRKSNVVLTLIGLPQESQP